MENVGRKAPDVDLLESKCDHRDRLHGQDVEPEVFYHGRPHGQLQGRTTESDNPTSIGVSLPFPLRSGHLVYFVFLMKLWKPPLNTVVGICVCVLVFGAHHAVSLWRSWKEEIHTRQNIGQVMWAPYPRIFPMHLTIIFGSVLIKGPGTLLLFLGLKTHADLLMEMRDRPTPVEETVLHEQEMVEP